MTRTSPPVVAMVHLGRAGSMGAAVRTGSLAEVFRRAGADVVDVRVVVEHRRSLRSLLRPGLLPVLTGHAVPESLAWDHRSVLRRLEALAPTVVVCNTARCYHPVLRRGPWTVVLDYVDRLSDSYRDRARILGRTPRAAAFRVLAALARRFEATPPAEGVVAIAAGWADARSLDLTWSPITVELADPAPGVTPTHDVLFVGKLSYEPNLEAVERLGRVWPAVLARRPGTTALLAGAAPPARVLEVATGLGWDVLADFDDLDAVMARARLAVVPLDHASGIQCKVLDAARYGVAQVVSPAAVRGMAPGLPALVADDDEALVAGIVALLEDPARRADLGAAARAHVADRYAHDRWVPWAAEVLAAAGRDRPRSAGAG